jgi:hypothetical protein
VRVDTIKCPECGAEIKLTESLAAPLVAELKRKHEQELVAKDQEIEVREADLQEQRLEILQAEKSIESRVMELLEAEKATLQETITAQEKESNKFLMQQKEQELSNAQEQLRQRDKKLAEAQAAQAEALRKERELEDKARELELEVERRVTANVSTIRTQAEDKAKEEARLSIAERDETIASMRKKIEDLKQKAEQGSQQLQGEVQELEIEAALREAFPFDVIEPVPKGVHGGDTLQHVNGPKGAVGTILWESKRTKTWSHGWLAKLRDDQRAAGADVAIIATAVMPKDVEDFGQIDGVWVVPLQMVIPVGAVLRQGLQEVHAARMASEGQETKMELVYQYLTSQAFRHRVEAIVEAFSTMQEDLEKEKRAITKQWAKRQQQLERMMSATTGMYGDLQGIAGQSLVEIDGLMLTEETTASGRARLRKGDVPKSEAR